MKTDNRTIDAALAGIERASTHPRELARQAVQRHRERATEYDFEKAPRELKTVMYGGTVRFKRRSWLARLLWWR